MRELGEKSPMTNDARKANVHNGSLNLEIASTIVVLCWRHEVFLLKTPSCSLADAKSSHAALVGMTDQVQGVVENSHMDKRAFMKMTQFVF